jgi:hypothetical protein
MKNSKGDLKIITWPVNNSYVNTEGILYKIDSRWINKKISHVNIFILSIEDQEEEEIHNNTNNPKIIDYEKQLK